MKLRIPSGTVELSAYVAEPGEAPGSGWPGVVLCHGFPVGAGRAATAGQTFPQLADRIAADLGFVALTFNFRGCGASEGDFSLSGWLDDVRAAVAHLAGRPGVRGVWVAGTDCGGALAVCAAARDKRVRGAAVLGAPADFEDWAGNARRFLDHARTMATIKDPLFPPSVEAWTKEFRELRPVDGARALAPRPLLVIHGREDEIVPTLDARLLAESHGAAELRFLSGAGHRLRHDPRAVAILLGWLDRQRNRAARRPRTA
ncbi:MAG TPA: alpha/beta fold hydrolase [Acidimicrobiales bacterium]